MKYKLLKVLAVLMILALFSAFALSEEAAEEINVGLDFESQEGGEGLEIDEQVIIETGSVEETPIEVDIDLSLETLETKSDATYRFIVNGEEYAVQTAQAGEKIEKPEDPAASEGKVFVGWSLVDGTPLFVDADGDGRIDPVIVSENEMDAEVYVWAEFAEEQPEEQSAEEPEQPAEESEQPAEEVPERPAEEPEQPAEEPQQPAEEPEQPAGEEPEQPAEESEQPTEEVPERPAEEPEQPAEKPEQPAEEEPEQPAEEEPVEQPAEEEPEQPAEEEPEQPTEEVPERPAEEPEQPAEEPEQPAEEPEQPTEEPEQPAEEPEQPAEDVPEQPAEEEPEQPAEEEPEQPAEEEAEQSTAEEEQQEQPEPVANALTYTGEVQMLFNGEATWLYSLDGVTYSEEIPTAINAGEYTVYYKADEADEPQSITVTVAKADVEFTPPVAAIGEG